MKPTRRHEKLSERKRHYDQRLDSKNPPGKRAYTRPGSNKK